MSTGALVPVLNPDTGNVHGIPTNQVDAARQAGGKPVATMKDPQGKLRYVPMEQVGDAQKAGGTLVPYGSQSSTQAAQDITGIHPDDNPVTSGIEGIGRTLKGIVATPFAMAKSAFAPPTNTEETAAEGAAGPVGLAADRMIIQPAKSAFSTAKDFYNTGNPFLAAGAALGALPVIGPTGQALGQRAASGDITGAVTEGISSALAPKLLEKGVGAAVSKFPSRANKVVVPGENYTPAHHQALSAALARGTGMGKDFIAPDVATDIGSPLRQAAADNPAKAKVIQNGSPKDALAATQSILEDAQHQIDYQHNAARNPVASTPVNMKPVQDAIPTPKSFYKPAEASAINDIRQRAGNVQTLEDLNDFRQYLNKQTAPTYRQSAIAAGRSSVEDDALMSAATAARNHYYDSLEQATGLDFQPAKRTEAGLMKAQESLQNASPGLVNRDVIANEHKGKLATAADVVEGGSKFAHGGLPVVGYLAERMRGTPLEQMHRQLKTAFSDLPQPSAYRGPLTSQYGQAQPKLPANTPGNANYGPPSQAAGSTGPAVPSTVTPNPGQPPQLPAQAGPEGQGIPPAPPSNPPPPLNEPTAVTNVNAGTPRPAQEAIPQRNIHVSPEGQAAIQRPALPPPGRPLDRATAKDIYDRAGRDPEKAREIARREGYQF